MVTLVRDESGATAIEYVLIAGLISVAAILGIEAAGDSLAHMFGTVASTIGGVL
jgi:pilus assembly protein Flp/PilA